MKRVDEQKNKILAEVLREIIDRRGLRQKALAKRINLTEASLSHILNGHSRPRQLTLTRLIRQLDATAEEEQRVLAAYDHSEMAALPVQPSDAEKPVPQDEIDRVKHYMEVKSMAVTFEEDVEKIVIAARFAFRRLYREGALICDFFLPGPPKVAVECKYNVNRDWDRTSVSVRLLRENLDLETVLVVVPYQNDETNAAKPNISKAGGGIVVFGDLERKLRSLMSGKVGNGNE